MSVLKRLVASILLLGFVLAPSGVLAQKMDSTVVESRESAKAEKVNSFELFWPIVAGKVGGEPLYFLKSLKETLRETLIFSDFKKADYNIRLSEKRAVEAERLFIEKKDYGNAKATLNAAQEKREKALGLIQKVESKGRYVTDLKNALRGSLEKQRALLLYVAIMTPQEQMALIDENLAQLNSTLAKLQ